MNYELYARGITIINTTAGNMGGAMLVRERAG